MLKARELITQEVHNNMPTGINLTANISLFGQIALEYAQPEPLSFTVNNKSSAIAIYPEKIADETDTMISLTGTYTSAYQKVSTFEDWDSVLFQIRNETNGNNDLIYTVDESGLHLGGQVNNGDMLTIRIESAYDDFTPIEKSIVVASNNSLIVSLVQRGITTAQYVSDESATLLIYNDEGSLAWYGSSNNGTIESSGLQKGKYTTVIVSSRLCESIPQKVSTLARMGLEENEDYLVQNVTIMQGQVTSITFGQIPTSNKTGGYANSATFTTNNKAPKVGSYFTLKANADLRNEFKHSHSNFCTYVHR